MINYHQWLPYPSSSASCLSLHHQLSFPMHSIHELVCVQRSCTIVYSSIHLPLKHHLHTQPIFSERLTTRLLLAMYISLKQFLHSQSFLSAWELGSVYITKASSSYTAKRFLKEATSCSVVLTLYSSAWYLLSCSLLLQFACVRTFIYYVFVSGVLRVGFAHQILFTQWHSRALIIRLHFMM